MKKILFGLGTTAAVIAPVVAIVSCGNGDTVSTITSATMFKAYFKDQGVTLTDDQAQKGFDEFKNGNSVTITKKIFSKANSTQSMAMYLVAGTPTQKLGVQIVSEPADFVDDGNHALDFAGLWKSAKAQDVNNEVSGNITENDIKNSSFFLVIANENGVMTAQYNKVVTDGTKFGVEMKDGISLN